VAVCFNSDPKAACIEGDRPQSGKLFFISDLCGNKDYSLQLTAIFRVVGHAASGTTENENTLRLSPFCLPSPVSWRINPTSSFSACNGGGGLWPCT